MMDDNMGILSCDEEEEDNDPIDQAFAQIIKGGSQKVELPKLPPPPVHNPAAILGQPFFPLPPLSSLRNSCISKKQDTIVKPDKDHYVHMNKEGIHSSLANFKQGIFDNSSNSTHLLLVDTSSDSSLSPSYKEDDCSNPKRLKTVKSLQANGHGTDRSVLRQRTGNHIKKINGKKCHDQLHSNESSGESDDCGKDDSKGNLFETLRRFDKKTKMFDDEDDETSSDDSSSSSSSDEDAIDDVESSNISPPSKKFRSSRSNHDTDESSESSTSSDDEPFSHSRKYSSERSIRSGEYYSSRDSGSDSRPLSSLKERLGLIKSHKRTYDEYRYDHKTQRETSIPPNFNPKTPPETNTQETRYRRSSRCSSISSNGIRDFYSANYDHKQSSPGRDLIEQDPLLNRTPMDTPPDEENLSPNWLQYVKNPESLREQYLNNTRRVNGAAVDRIQSSKPEPESPVRPNLESRIKGILGFRSSSAEDSPVKADDSVLKPRISRPLSRPPSPFLHKNAYLHWYKETYLFKKNHKIGTYPCADPTVRRKIGIQIKGGNTIKTLPGTSTVLSFTPLQRSSRKLFPDKPLPSPAGSSVLDLPLTVQKVSDRSVIKNGLVTKINVAPDTELELCSPFQPDSKGSRSTNLLEAVKERIVIELKNSLKSYLSKEIFNSAVEETDVLSNAKN